MITKDEFKLMQENFLSTLDSGTKDEWYATPYDMADGILSDLYDFLFKADIDKEARRLQYLELQKEFG